MENPETRQFKFQIVILLRKNANSTFNPLRKTGFMKMDVYHKVFVYGTLKTGEPNHHVFKGNMEGRYKLLCDAATVEKYPLIIGTKYNIPFLLQEPGTGHNVKGELYEVDDKVLTVLDELEDHPNFYVREEVDVISSKDSNIHKAWIYFIKNFQRRLLNNIMLECYTNNGQSPKYVESEEATLDDLHCA
ncbi:putative gamma-glutamylcyclotransferase CG2811 isoform X2 [Harmonia axyridis]|uniref:putative gamma-glutamylcyclotransferase CG2811 isoform X2 n=1 Tax=Harmonia axyridis TaxID=115357 RepID=UPI001E2765E3|nr:putative gamma-glutamylcyclotransferase CG2811 isoform X2 [Harmonia axyridis]